MTPSTPFLLQVEWSPDSRIILFVTAEGDILIYDADGTKLKNMNLSAVRQMDIIKSNDARIVGIDWFKVSVYVRVRIVSFVMFKAVFSPFDLCFRVLCDTPARPTLTRSSRSASHTTWAWC